MPIGENAGEKGAAASRLAGEEGHVPEIEREAGRRVREEGGKTQ